MFVFFCFFEKNKNRELVLHLWLMLEMDNMVFKFIFIVFIFFNFIFFFRIVLASDKFADSNAHCVVCHEPFSSLSRHSFAKKLLKKVYQCKNCTISVHEPCAVRLSRNCHIDETHKWEYGPYIKEVCFFLLFCIVTFNFFLFFF